MWTALGTPDAQDWLKRHMLAVWISSCTTHAHFSAASVVQHRADNHISSSVSPFSRLLSVGSIDRTVFLQVVVDLEKAMGVVAEGCNGMGEGPK